MKRSRNPSCNRSSYPLANTEIQFRASHRTREARATFPGRYWTSRLTIAILPIGDVLDHKELSLILVTLNLLGINDVLLSILHLVLL